MKKIFFILLLTVIANRVFAQVENVIVETYYVSDVYDETDTTGGHLLPGSVTYRIYLDMKPGTKLRKIYGDTNHALRFTSTENFFNNIADGQTFAKDISKNRYAENTVALDSWLTIGQVTRVAATTYFGVLKSDDANGSFVGGAHNDGGSAGITGGLLNNNDPLAGIPVTTADGFSGMSMVPSAWADYGFRDAITNIDSTIFGSVKEGNEFISHNAGIQNSGVCGVNPDSNIVLVAQLTTHGQLSFEINVEVEENNNGNPVVVKYVAKNENLQPGEKLCSRLAYPPVCGCTDAHYVEYSPEYSCTNTDSCRTLIRFGCKDPMACNYDPDANFDLPAMCCYPGYCNDRNISVVCPQLDNRRISNLDFGIYPNPSANYVNVNLPSGEDSYNMDIYNNVGELILRMENIGSGNHQLDISEYRSGVYSIRVYSGTINKNLMFVRQ